MHTILKSSVAAAITFAFAGEALATEWNVSLWGKRRAFTEHVEKLAELVSEKTNGEFTLNISYGGLSNNRSLEQEVEISMAVYQHPAVQADLARWDATLLMPSPLPQYNLAGVGDAPASLADFDGLSVRATGGIGAAMGAVGAVPTSMSATEVRQAMDSGIVCQMRIKRPC